MFPSAANIPEGKSETQSPNGTSWLHSTSYVPKVIESKSNNPRKKHLNIKKRKRPHSPSIDDHIKSEVIDVDFIIDTKGNPALLEFGCTYEGDVPKFNENVRIPILGCPKRLRIIDLEPDLREKETKHNISRRYFSKKNRSLLAKCVVGQTLSPKIESRNEPGRSFYTVVQEGLISHSESVESISICSKKVDKVADLNRAVYDNPQDLKSWFELVELQPSNVNNQDEGQRPLESSISNRYAILDRQLAVVERAAEKNHGNLRLRLLKAAMYEYATELITAGACRNSSEAHTKKHNVALEWYDLVRVCPQFVGVWRGYLSYLRGRFAVLDLMGGDGEQRDSFNRINGLYRRALDTLSGLVVGRIVSHRPTDSTADEAVDLLAEYCQWLSQTGFTERAFSIWQALIEFTCFCPPGLQSQGLSTSYQQRREFKNFWTAPDRGPAFGVPGACGWAAWDSGRSHGTGGRRFADGLIATDPDPVLAELEEDWGPNSSTAEARWKRIVKDWSDIGDAAEDALLNYGVNLPKIVTHDSKIHHSTEGSLNSRRSRGLAWLGLERVRESVGWLPADATMDDPSVLEDTERVPKFEDIEPLLLEVHLDPKVLDESLLQRRKQRMILLFLEFLGVWEPDVARTYKLPAELEQLHELSSVSCLQRQAINPRQFGFPWLRPGLENLSNTGSVISYRMRSVLVSSSLEQASRLFPTDVVWQSSIRRLMFHYLSSQIEQALSMNQITPKAALTLWRKKAKGLLEQSQSDLNLWLAYAKGLTRTACAVSVVKSPLFSEARKVFTSTLRMFPLPAELPTNLEEQLNTLLPRLRILHAFVEFELGVNFSIDQTKSHSHVECFNRILHLIQHAAIGGAFIPVSEKDVQTVSVIPNAVDELDLRLEALCSQSSHSSEYNYISEMAAIVASLRLCLQLVTQNEVNFHDTCEKIFKSLLRVDCEEDRQVGAGYASRCFLRLVLPILSTVSTLLQRNRTSLINILLGVMSNMFDINSTMPLLTSPFEWTHLLPFKVAANCRANADKTCTIEILSFLVTHKDRNYLNDLLIILLFLFKPCVSTGYQRRLQGLLPPLVLSSLESRLTENVRGVCAGVTRHLMATCSRDTVRPHRFDQAPPLATEPARLLGLPSSQQTEIMARLLPSSLDLLFVGLELEHWTSLVAGTDRDSIRHVLNSLRVTVRKISAIVEETTCLCGVREREVTNHTKPIRATFTSQEEITGCSE
ncbi:unnamed protein product [Rodentolepis nana]|uniref:NRDE-2, necessary for RNA interference-domain-containing protein n=1 Tax=Rodentolepis nana TaxID=102285 RepID=A0A0R3TRH6_RODNA|nr:unnamed protein product [Rodentolepis nana]